MYSFLLVVGLVPAALQTQDACSALESLSQQQLWNLLRPSTVESMFLLSAGGLSILLLLLTLLTYGLYRSFSMPADIMFAICIAELVENTSLVASAIYFKVHTSRSIPADFHGACTSIGIFYTLGNTASLIYNLIFCIVVSTSLKKTLKGTLFRQSRYHVLALIFVGGVTAALASTRAIGTGFNGVCGYKLSSRESISRFIVELVICSICLACMLQFRAKIPRNDYFQKVAVFGYYYYYMGMFSLIQVATTISFMVGNIACRTGSPYSSHIITYSIFVSTIFSILLSYFLVLLRFAHPVVRIRLRQLLCGDEKSEEEEDPWLGNLLESIKGSQIISIFSGILITTAHYEHKIPQGAIGEQHFRTNYVMGLNEAISDEYILRRSNPRESALVRQKLEGLRALDYEVTLYAAGMFARLISAELDANIFRSFDLGRNIPLIKMKSLLNGGKSGEFLFSSYDHQFIFKTIKQDEALVYIQKLSEFYAYFQENPGSLIAKILGLYRFKRHDISEEPFYLIVMRNVSPYDRSTYERIYDIKGSEFNRSTMDEKKISNPDKLRHITLKDLDFKKLEGRVSIEFKQSQKIKELIRKDAEFLSRMGVMDYSVLIIKRKFDHDGHGSELKMNECRSTRNEDEYFSIGIIDYLESWTLKRKAERALKSMITSKKVTAASPDEYSYRLTHFLDEIM